MRPLEKGLRNELERTVKEARDVAEAAARAALEQLGVGEAEPFKHLSMEDRELRRKLRIHGRQLGDARNATTEVQEIDRLVEEVAYEHWHRMLFARFLAENNLLMYPDPADPVAVTLEECEDLAADEGARNGWELASRFASKMLPQIFRPESPVFQLTLPPEHQQKLERLVAGLSPAVFTASDSLGWVYQFWQAKRKDEVNASEVKIGARELPAVTQLFTEPYMVSFLLDNSLGAWWAARRLSETDLKTAESEEELRRKAALPNVPLDYLRFVKGEDGAWTPAAGTFDGWPKHLSELKTLDPCCGSGHFLVAAFLMLVPMRMALEGLSACEAVDAVLRENLHGLEIDQRCVELAAFALALTAWRYPDAGGYRPLPELNVACSGLAISAKKEEWLALAGDNTNLRLALEELYRQFKDAPVLGSLINPESSLGKGSLFELKWEEVGPLLEAALATKKDDFINEMSVVAQGLARAASSLSSKYDLIFTNVPFLTQIKFSDPLDNYIDKYLKPYKANLATAMIARVNKLLNSSGAFGFVAPQSWWFLKRYQQLRRDYINSYQINLLARLGERAFESPQANGEQVGLSLCSNLLPGKSSEILLIDVSDEETRDAKAIGVSTKAVSRISQHAQKDNENSAILFGGLSEHPALSSIASAFFGSSAGDRLRFVRGFWEVNSDDHRVWEYLQSSPSREDHFSGLEECILWEMEAGQMFELAESVKHLNHKAQQWRSGKPNWNKWGVVTSLMAPFPAGIYTGNIYDTNCCAIVPEDDANLTSLVTFGRSADFCDSIRSINQNRKVEVKTVLSISFDQERWYQESKESYPSGLPNPYSNQPNQSIFHGHPCGSVIWDEEKKWTAHGPLRTDDSVLHVAVARLLGYRWPAELDANMELADEQREWVERCKELLPHADDDGIVCIPPVRGEAPAADRLLNLLAAAYGDSWNNDKLSQLLKQADHAGKTLETWLRDKFFVQHCKLFQHRPFIWHIWDGLRDGFAALVNYHKLDTKLLETLIYTYLGDWISRQKQDIANRVDGAEEKLAAAENLKKRLELIREGEKPYDIFVRWKPIEKQPIGWEPDLNDGVRLNIRPFLSVPDVAKKGAGVLREKPNIDWKKDRGQDVNSAPWHHLFNGDRINDYHLRLEEKRKARSAMGNEA